MALIGKIREKSALLVIVIGIALLAFILPEFLKSSTGTDDVIGYGTVYGEKINEDLLRNDFARFEENDRREFQQQQRDYTQKDQDASLDKAFNYRSETIILEREFEALGLDVSQAELDAYLYGTDGFEVMPDLASSFVDSLTGQFSAKLLQSTIERLQSSDKLEERKSWEESKDYYINKRKQEKYLALLKQGVYVTQLEAEQDYLANKEVKNISYVTKRFSDIANDKIELSDKSKREYYENHKNDKKYEVKKSTREVKYFDINLKPSASDISSFNKLIADIKAGFGTTQNDSSYVLANSDSRFFSSTHLATFRPEGDAKAREGLTIPADMDSVFNNASIGQVVGPYEENGSTRIAKVLDFNTKLLKVRHILIAAPKAEIEKVAIAQAKADSLLALINKDNFGQYVLTDSEDPGSKDKGGVYDEFLDYEMVPEFSNFAIDQPIGTIGKVQTDYGIHIIEVMDKKEVKYPVLAVIQKTLKPSQITADGAEDEVYKVLYELDEKLEKIASNKMKLEKFDTIVQKAGYFARSIKIEENKPKVYGFNTPFAENKILTLAFNKDAKVGDLIATPVKDKDRYVIAIIASINNKGIPSYESIEKDIEAVLIKEEKAKRLASQMVSKSINELSSTEKLDIKKAEVNLANSQITGSGFEPEIVGTIFSGVKDGAVSIPVKGESGVYVFRVDNTTKAPSIANYTIEQDQLLTTAQSSVFNQARKALLDKANIVDNRRFLSSGIRR